MSRNGNRNDNAFVRTWFKSLKAEWIDTNSFAVEAQLRILVFEYIANWYNRQSLHSCLGYRRPVEHEAKQLAA